MLDRSTMVVHRLGLVLTELVTSLLLCSLVVVDQAWSWIPPHPNATKDWESVHDLRRRLNIDFGYSTSRYVDAEMCRYLTEEECEENDKSMQEHVRAHKKLQTQVRNNPNLGSIQVRMVVH